VEIPRGKRTILRRKRSPAQSSKPHDKPSRHVTTNGTWEVPGGRGFPLHQWLRATRRAWLGPRRSRSYPSRPPRRQRGGLGGWRERGVCVGAATLPHRTWIRTHRGGKIKETLQANPIILDLTSLAFRTKKKDPKRRKDSSKRSEQKRGDRGSERERLKAKESNGGMCTDVRQYRAASAARITKK
jgi:hypothetical protein